MPALPDDQLELFDVAEAPGQPRPQPLGVVQVRVRYDQVIIGGIVTLIGLTVVFAMGVERGKQLVRAERMLLPGRDAPAEPAQIVAPAQGSAEETVPDTRQASPIPSEPKKKIRTRARYAVQVVTYARPQLARRELERLRQNGEPAFLAQSGGHTVLYVGPFTSKLIARKKGASLKPRYGDCFVKSL